MRLTPPALSYASIAAELGILTSVGHDGLPPGWSWHSDENFSTMCHAIFAERSPWLGMSRCGIPLLIPYDAYPRLFNVSIGSPVAVTGAALSTYYDAWFTYRAQWQCPFCHTPHNKSSQTCAARAAATVRAYACDMCGESSWPFCPNIEMPVSPLPPNMLTFYPQPEKE